MGDSRIGIPPEQPGVGQFRELPPKKEATEVEKLAQKILPETSVHEQQTHKFTATKGMPENERAHKGAVLAERMAREVVSKNEGEDAPSVQDSSSGHSVVSADVEATGEQDPEPSFVDDLLGALAPSVPEGPSAELENPVVQPEGEGLLRDAPEPTRSEIVEKEEGPESRQGEEEISDFVSELLEEVDRQEGLEGGAETPVERARGEPAEEVAMFEGAEELEPANEMAIAGAELADLGNVSENEAIEHAIRQAIQANKVNPFHDYHYRSALIEESESLKETNPEATRILQEVIDQESEELFVDSERRIFVDENEVQVVCESQAQAYKLLANLVANPNVSMKHKNRIKSHFANQQIHIISPAQAQKVKAQAQLRARKTIAKLKIFLLLLSQEKLESGQKRISARKGPIQTNKAQLEQPTPTEIESSETRPPEKESKGDLKGKLQKEVAQKRVEREETLKIRRERKEMRQKEYKEEIAAEERRRAEERTKAKDPLS